MLLRAYSPRFLYRLALVTIFLLSAFLCLWRLDHTPFWDDEAHISIVARNFLATGELTGWDGHNLIGYRNGSFLDANLRTRNAPLDCWLVAASFKLFGTSTIAGRLPFVLSGLLSLVSFAYLLRREFRSRLLVLYSLSLFALGVVFILNARTCRYNVLAFLFSVGAYAAYRRFLHDKRFGSLLACVAAFVGLFYASYLFALAFGVAMLTVTLVFHRHRFSRHDTLPLLGAFVLFLWATIPYTVRYRVWDYPRLAHDPFWPHFWILLWRNTRDLSAVAPNIWPLAVLGGITWFFSRQQPRDATQQRVAARSREWALLCAAYIVVLCVFSPQTLFNPIADSRYLLPIAPFLAGLSGIVLWNLHRMVQRLAPLTLLGVLCFNIPLCALHSCGWLLPAYLRENLYPYPISTDAVLAYLRAHPAGNQQLECEPPNMNLALMFYEGNRVRVCCQLWPNTPLPPQATARLNSSQFREGTFPDRFIQFGSETANFEATRQYYERKHIEGSSVVQYRYRLEDTLPVYWDQTQRPDLFWHSFGPRRDYNPATDAVYIYRRELRSSTAVDASSFPLLSN